MMDILREEMKNHVEGFSTKKIARTSCVSLRMIQMYEQKQNDLNKAQGITLRSLSRTLGCTMEDYLDKNTVKVLPIPCFDLTLM